MMMLPTDMKLCCNILGTATAAILTSKYDKLCEEFDELQENYNELCEDYYEE